MKLHDVIRTRRQTLGLTQEELARRLGVSAPAVNKWERSIHYPDITLLPSLARVLGVDLNTLLSFQEDMTEEDIGLFLNRIYETAGAEGVAAAFALARNKLPEFPNSDLLAYHAAGMLMGVLELQPEDDSPERRAQEAEVTALYERCIRSADCQIREWAALPWPAGVSDRGVGPCRGAAGAAVRHPSGQAGADSPPAPEAGPA